MPAEDLRRNLIFLERNAWVVEGILGQIAEKLAERFGPMEGMACDEPVNLAENLGSIGHEGVPVTGMLHESKIECQLHAKWGFRQCNSIKRLETSGRVREAARKYADYRFGVRTWGPARRGQDAKANNFTPGSLGQRAYVVVKHGLGAFGRFGTKCKLKE